jgi:hypothetical protein
MKNRLYLYPGRGKGEAHYLDRVGTVKDFAESGMTLTGGTEVGFWMDDANEQGGVDNLLFEGIVHFDAERQQWYALIDWDSFHHESDEPAKQSSNG